tara:strand:+ start:10353 stop:11000 length:648 start_codon:yes stop_codon:yes gene_type:complete
MNLNESFADWQNNIPKINLNTTIDYVLTGKNINSIEPSKELLNYIHKETEGDNLNILDFGCGVCRNVIFLSESLPKSNIYGYDNDPMLDRGRELTITKYNKNLDNIPNVHLSSNWNWVKQQKFDLIYATLVFQHIPEPILTQYLTDIKSMTNTLLVAGRRFNDEINANLINNDYPYNQKNTWQILENNGLKPYFCNKEYSVDGDPHGDFLCLYKI